MVLLILFVRCFIVVFLELSEVISFVLFFRSDLQLIDNSGFGSVAVGCGEEGHFENLSTQAVMDLIRNVHCNDGHEVVKMSAQDIDLFNINRSDASVQDGTNVLGNLRCFFDEN